MQKRKTTRTLKPPENSKLMFSYVLVRVRNSQNIQINIHDSKCIKR